MSIKLQVPDVKELKPCITVFGVGGAGGNAVNNMIRSGLEGVDFVVANTDAQALSMSAAERRVQMGADLTEGLGAGSQPEVGRAAAEEVADEIRDQLSGSHMAFITAGMGGGTGTGAAPVIARTAREQGILTVGVVTKPFQFEGKRRQLTAEAGITEMQKYVDTLIVIPNQNLFRVANEKTTFADAFAMADQVLYSGVACITDLIVKEGLINLDFADVRAVMSEMGSAMMGTGEAAGEKRAVEAAEAAISNPLLDDVSMRGARGLLISITGGQDLTLYEVDEAATRIREEVDADANIILGATFDDDLEGVIRVSVVATGIDASAMAQVQETTAVLAGSLADTGFDVQEIEAPEMDEEEDFSAHEAYAEEMALPEADMEETLDNGVRLRPLTPEAEAELDAAFNVEVEDIREAEEADYIPPEPAQPERAAAPRMPSVDEFPMPGQNQLRAYRGEEPQEHKEKAGFFKRLANAGFGSREDHDEAHAPAQPVAPAAPSAAPAAASSAEPPQQRASAFARRERGIRDQSGPAPVRTTRLAGNVESAPGDDDQLEIPAFLRRQAN